MTMIKIIVIIMIIVTAGVYYVPGKSQAML